MLHGVCEKPLGNSKELRRGSRQGKAPWQLSVSNFRSNSNAGWRRTKTSMGSLIQIACTHFSRCSFGLSPCMENLSLVEAVC
mmetsp:Transcript_96962/g.172592  ORF Transcript_96962/g.172592 Transcript_96962/m.172592 type:complete len:82 (+) Transcript_96962:1715-1960(+)